MRKRNTHMHVVSGSCHCGNITYEVTVQNRMSGYRPRACDCDFCIKHGAAYLSDNNGKLTVTANNQGSINKYKQGSGIADFLLCTKCGVLIGVTYEEHGSVYGAINTKVFPLNTELGEEKVISPQRLSDSERINRWKEMWFSDVQIKYCSA